MSKIINKITTNFTGLAIPLPAVIISLSVENYKFKIHSFPPNICIRNGAVWFYSVTLITDVFAGVVTYLLFVVFWISHKVNNVFCNKLFNYYDCVRNLHSNQSLQKIEDD